MINPINVSYKKQNYKIIGTNSINYNKDYDTWKVINEPKLGNESKSSKDKKTISLKSNSSSDRSIAEETDSEDEDKKKKGFNEVCLLKIK